jgi:hypothetical protein
MSVEGEEGSGAGAGPPAFLCGDMELRTTTPGMEVHGLKDPQGQVNWDHVESVFKYGVEGHMRLDMKEYPLMMAESMFHTKVCICGWMRLSMHRQLYVLMSCLVSLSSTPRHTHFVTTF